MFKIVAYYTFDTGYEKEIKNLLKSLNEFNLDYNIEGIESLGSWRLNCAYKSKFILSQLKNFPKHNIVYIDSDAIILEYPDLFNYIKEDFAVHYKGGYELLSGTLYFKNCEPCIQLLEAWIQHQEKNPTSLDQKILQEVLQTFKISTFNLPPTYVQIFDSMSNTGDPIIKHTQASRKYRSII